MRRTSIVASWAVTLASPIAGSAQERVAVPNDLACECELRVDLLTTLRDFDGRAGLSMPIAVEREPSGGYLVVPQTRQGAVLHFDARGNYVATIGRPGQGPEEFGAVIAIRPGLADSILVMDAANRRLAVLGPELTIARTGRLTAPGGWFGVVATGDIIVLSSIPASGTRSSNRLILLDPSFEVKGSFMPSPVVGPDKSVASLRRRIAVSRAGMVAVSHWDRYVIEVWGVDGSHSKTLTRDPSWFDHVPAGTATAGPPRSVQEAPRIDPEGRIWTMSHIADEHWEQSLGPVRSLRGGTAVGLPVGNQNGYYDSVVEVIDPDSGRLLASARVDPHLTFVSDDGHAVSYREDELGNPFVDLWALYVVAR